MASQGDSMKFVGVDGGCACCSWIVKNLRYKNPTLANTWRLTLGGVLVGLYLVSKNEKKKEKKEKEKKERNKKKGGKGIESKIR